MTIPAIGTILVSKAAPFGPMYRLLEVQTGYYFVIEDQYPPKGGSFVDMKKRIVSGYDVVPYEENGPYIYRPGVHIVRKPAYARWRKGTLWWSVVNYIPRKGTDRLLEDLVEARFIYPVADRPDFDPRFDSPNANHKGKALWRHEFHAVRDIELRKTRCDMKTFAGFVVTANGLVHKAMLDGVPICYSHQGQQRPAEKQSDGEGFRKSPCMTCQKTHAAWDYSYSALP